MLRKLRVDYFITGILLFSFKIFTINYSALELYSKNNQNLNFFESFIFFWTNNWTTVPFFLSLFCIFTGTFIYFLKSGYASFFIFCGVLYVSEIALFFGDNLQSNTLDLTLYNQSALLLNNLNEIHPFFLYTAVSLFLRFLVVWSFSRSLSTVFSNTALLKNSGNFTIVLLLTSFVAVFLGSWWAEQEQSWNGWWNWDSSETLSLGVPLYCILAYHVKLKQNRFWNSQSFNFNFLTLNIFLYALVQINFTQTNHNFGFNFSFFFNNFYFLSAAAAFVFFFWGVKNNRAASWFNFFYEISTFPINYSFFYRYKTFIYFCFSVFLIKIFFVSFSLNFSAKSWAIYAINVLNETEYFYIESYLISVFLIFFFLNLKKKLKLLLVPIKLTHFFLINFILLIALNNCYENFNSCAYTGAPNLFLSYFLLFSGKNYAISSNFFEVQDILIYWNERGFFTKNVRLFDFFDSNALSPNSYFNNFINFFIKNEKLEIFEANFVSHLSTQYLFFWSIFVRLNNNFQRIKYKQSVISAYV